MNHPVLTSIFLTLGVFSVLTGVTGVGLMRNAAARLHYVNATALVAPPLFMAAILCEQGFSQAGLTAILIVVLLWLQGPVLAHVIGRAIHSHERQPRDEGKES